MVKRKLTILLFLFAAATLHAKLSELRRTLEALDAQKANPNWREVSRLHTQMAVIKGAMRTEADDGVRPLLWQKSIENLTDDFSLLDLRIYEWTTDKNRILTRLKSTSLAYTDWVKAYFTLYSNGNVQSNTFTYIDFISYGYSGVLPFHETILESFIDNVTFDSIGVRLEYDITDGSDAFLCDQILQQVTNTLTPAYRGFNWEGMATNASTYSVEFPIIYAKVMHLDSLVEAPSTYLDTECQGNRTVIIDYVTTTPPEAQEIMLRNCSDQAIDLSGWYLGDANSFYAYRIPDGTSIDAKGFLGFDNNDINFTIDQQGETIYLFDANKNLVDQWTEDENDHILYPLTSACYSSYFELTRPYDAIRYKFSYALHSLTGSGNIAPNEPVPTLSRYEIAPGREHLFSFFVIDGNHDAVKVQVDWGDGERSGWIGPTASGTLLKIPHTFAAGEYLMSARTLDSWGATSTWNDSTTIWVSSSVPVEIADFSAHALQNNILLEWRTLSETNNLGFDIERSGDGAAWRKIGFCSGMGTTTKPQSYLFLDSEPMPGLAYYRLKQIDSDGTLHYSEIIAAKSSGLRRIVLHPPQPNPFNSMTQLTYELPDETTVNLSVYNLQGKRIATLFEGRHPAGQFRREWNAQGYATGIYILRLTAGHHVSQIKCVLIK